MKGDDFIASVGKFANKFKSLGIKPGSHVAIVALNHMSYLPAKLAVIAAGGVPVLFNPLYTREFFLTSSFKFKFYILLYILAVAANCLKLPFTFKSPPEEEMEKLLILSDCSYALGHMCSNDLLEEICTKLKIKLLPQVEFLAEYCK